MFQRLNNMKKFGKKMCEMKKAIHLKTLEQNLGPSSPSVPNLELSCLPLLFITTPTHTHTHMYTHTHTPPQLPYISICISLPVWVFSADLNQCLMRVIKKILQLFTPLVGGQTMRVLFYTVS